MPAQVTAQVSVNGAVFSVAPMLADSIAPRGAVVLNVTVSFGLDVDDLAALLLRHLDDWGSTDELAEDAEAWEAVADRLANEGLGMGLTGSRDSLAIKTGDPMVAWCRQRAASLLSAETDRRDIGSVVPFPSRPVAARESVAMSR